jgi:hypothetical protein
MVLGAQRITCCKRFGPYGPRGCVRLGHSATLHSHGSLHPQFVGPKNATHFSIRAAKPSLTAGTLYAIAPKIFVNIS